MDLELENKYCSAHSLNTEIFLLCFVMMSYARSLGLCVLLDSPQLVEAQLAGAMHSSLSAISVNLTKVTKVCNPSPFYPSL